jgi:hypothetical protein
VRGTASFMENFEAANSFQRLQSNTILVRIFDVFYFRRVSRAFSNIYARRHSAGPRFSQTLTSTHSPH